jgi:hypothetical protein
MVVADLDDMEAGWNIHDNLFESIHDCMFVRPPYAHRSCRVLCSGPEKPD